MVRPSAESLARPLTDAQSLDAGDGTLVGDDGVDIDDGAPGSVGTGGGSSPIHFEPAASGTITPDWSDAPVWDLTLVDDIDIADAVGWPASGSEGIVKLIIRQDGTGGWDITSWGSAYEFPDSDGVAGGSAPSIHSAADSVTVLYLQTEDGGTTVGVSSDGGSSSPAEEVFIVHGAMGSTETFDPADGHSHTGTLDADCTATITAPAGDGPIQMEWWITQDGTGGWVLTIAASGGSVVNDTTPDTTASGVVRYVLDRIPGTTNDWIVNLVGSAASSSGHWELLVDPGSPPDPYYADGDFLYVEVS